MSILRSRVWKPKSRSRTDAVSVVTPDPEKDDTKPDAHTDASLNLLGITVLYENKKLPAKADILFVHGLNGKPYSTWLDKKTNTHWPSQLLPKDIPHCRMLSFGYDSTAARFSKPTSQAGLLDHARSLLEQLFTHRKNTGAAIRPIIFVVHSLGGLLVKSMLYLSAQEREFADIQRFTSGIIFLATPQKGSTIADSALSFTDLLPMGQMQVNKELLRGLKFDSDVLRVVNDWFHRWLPKRIKPEDGYVYIACFCEELPMKVGFKMKMIVDRESASLPRYGCAMIHSDHKGMVKFPGDPNMEGYNNYRLVCEKIKMAVFHVKERSPLQTETDITNEENKTRTVCLSSLDFAGIRTRVDTIPDNCENTLEWIWEVEDFNLWLEKPKSPVFVISGKPGSGKSTLMKYISRSEKLAKALQSFYPYNKRFIMSHFFDNDPQNMTNSLEGFLRSLLYQLVSAERGFIRLIRETFQALRRYQEIPTWSKKDLKDACLAIFKSIGEELVDKGPVIFLFIDAINQFTGNTAEMKSFLAAITQAAPDRLKICVSSSSDGVYHHQLNGHPKIEIQAYNRQDIQKFISHEHEEISQIFLEGDYSLADKILDKSDGVFLWVCLVCESIKRGRFTKKNLSQTSKKELLQLIERLPDDLLHIYQQIYDSIPNHETADIYLSLVVAAQRRLSLDEIQCAVHFHNSSDDDDAVPGVERSELEEPDTFEEDFGSLIQDRCGGLLQVTRTGSTWNNKTEWVVEPCHATALVFLRDHCQLSEASPYERLVPYGHDILLEVTTRYLGGIHMEHWPEGHKFQFGGAEIPDSGRDNLSTEKSSDLWSSTAAAERYSIPNFIRWSSKFPLLWYASESWAYHGTQISSSQVQKAYNQMNRLVGVPFKIWREVFWEIMDVKNMKTYNPADMPRTWIEHACANGCEAVLEMQLARKKALKDNQKDPNTQADEDDMNESARLLFAAIRARSLKIVKCVLKHCSPENWSADRRTEAVLQAIDFSYHRVVDGSGDDGKIKSNILSHLLDNGFPLTDKLFYTIRDAHWSSNTKGLRVKKRSFICTPLLLSMMLHLNGISQNILSRIASKDTKNNQLDWVLRSIIDLSRHITPINTKGIKLVLESGASMYGDDPESTALGMALSFRQLEVAETLLANGANPNFSRGSTSQLSHIVGVECEDEDPEGTLLLLKYDARIDAESLQQALMWAPRVSRDAKNVISVLLKHLYDSNIDYLINDRETALHISIRLDREDVVKTLVGDFGARTNIQDFEGNFPITFALRHPDEKAARYIKLLGQSPSFSPNITMPREMMTAFQNAVLSQKLQAIGALLECGLCPDQSWVDALKTELKECDYLARQRYSSVDRINGDEISDISRRVENSSVEINLEDALPPNANSKNISINKFLQDKDGPFSLIHLSCNPTISGNKYSFGQVDGFEDTIEELGGSQIGVSDLAFPQLPSLNPHARSIFQICSSKIAQFPLINSIEDDMTGSTNSDDVLSEIPQASGFRSSRDIIDLENILAHLKL